MACSIRLASQGMASARVGSRWVFEMTPTPLPVEDSIPFRRTSAPNFWSSGGAKVSSPSSSSNDSISTATVMNGYDPDDIQERNFEI